MGFLDRFKKGLTRTREKVATLDPSRSHARLSFSDASAELLGEDGGGWAATQNIFNRAAVLYAWEQTGGSDAALEMAKEYALGTETFIHWGSCAKSIAGAPTRWSLPCGCTCIAYS